MKAVTLHDYKKRLVRVLVHIQQHLDDPLPLSELAALACLSPCHFHRIFSGMVGESVHAHVRRLRLERAAGQLQRETYPVVEIALRAGFETHEAFTRAFRQSFNSSPSEYRKKHRRPALLPALSKIHYSDGHPLQAFRSARPSPSIVNVKIISLPPMRVAFIRHVGPYGEVGPVWDRLCAALGSQGLLGPDAKILGLSHDDPCITAPDKLRYDACVTVGESFTPSGEIGVQVIPGGDYAVLTHFGPYARLNDTYTRLIGEWLPRSGRELRSASCFEIYLNTPENTEPEELLTDIHAPLEPIARR